MGGIVGRVGGVREMGRVCWVGEVGRVGGVGMVIGRVMGV